jgi:hypothetical protein
VWTVVSLISGTLIGMEFDEPATGDARSRIAAFFDPPAAADSCGLEVAVAGGTSSR